METQDMNTGDGQVKNGATNFIEDRSTELHGAINKAVDTTKPAVDHIAASAHKGVDQISNTITGVTGTVADSTRMLMDACQHYVDTGRNYVRASPVISTVIAMAVGYGLSKLLGGEHKDR